MLKFFIHKEMPRNVILQDKANYFGTDKCHKLIRRYCDRNRWQNKIDISYFGVSFPCDLTKFFPLLTVRNAIKSSNVLK